MPHQTSRNDPIALSQEQEPKEVAASIDEIRLKAAEFEDSIRVKQRRDLTVGLLAIAVFALTIEQGLAQAIEIWRLAPPALLIAGTLFVISQIQRRNQLRSLPAEASADAVISIHRQQLQQQRERLQSMWRWYFFPFVPGFASAVMVAAIVKGVDTKLIGSLVLLVLVMAGGWARNRQSAQKIDRRLRN